MQIGLSLSLTQPRGGGEAVTYSAEALAYFERRSVPLSTSRKAIYDELFVALVASGVYARGHALYAFVGNQSDTLLNLLSSSFTATLGGGMTSAAYTDDVGYIGDATAHHINTTINDNTVTALDDVSVGAWVSEDGGGVLYTVGTDSGSSTLRLAPRTASNATARVHSTNGPSGAVADRLGFSLAERTASGADAIYRNGSSIATSTTASTAKVNNNITFLRNGSQYANDRIVIGWVGQSLGALNSNLYAALNTFLTAIAADDSEPEPEPDPEFVVMRESFTQRGITFEFAESTQTVLSVCGDIHTINGTLVATEPACTLIDGTYEGAGSETYTNRRINGAMTNPGRDGVTGTNPNLTPNGWDNLPKAPSVAQATEVPYDDAKNTAPEYTGVPITGAVSVVKALSTGANDRTKVARDKLDNAAIWTNLDEIPAGPFFRRWAGNVDKTPIFFEDDIDWSLLVQDRALPSGATLPTMEFLLTRLGPFQLYMNQLLFCRGITPRNLQEVYGADIINDICAAWNAARTIGFPLEDAKTLMRLIIQFGLDVRDATKFGRRWSGALFAFGGAHQCFKLPMIIASHFLHDAAATTELAEMVAYCDTDQNRIFGDDIMTFQIGRVEIEGSPNQPIQNRIEPTGYPPWAENTVGWMVQPSSLDAMGFNFEIAYRLINGFAFIMSAYMTRTHDKEAAWNNPVFFEYCDHLWDLWKYRGEPLSARFDDFPRAYLLEDYEDISPNYQDAVAPAAVRFMAEGRYAWIEFDKNLTLAYQPASGDLAVEVDSSAVDLTGVTTTASGVRSTGSTNVNAPVITVADTTGFRVGARLVSTALTVDTFIVSVDDDTGTVGISSLVAADFTDVSVSTVNVLAYGRAVAAVLPVPLTSISQTVEIAYTKPVSNGVRSLGGVQIETIASTSCTNQTVLLPDPASSIDTIFSGEDAATRQFSGTRAPRSEPFKRIRISFRYMKYGAQSDENNILTAITAGSGGFRIYHPVDDDLRVIIGGQGLRFPGALTGAPYNEILTVHCFLDLTKTVLADAIKGAVVWDGGGNTNLSTTGTTYTRDGSDEFDIATVFSQGLYAFSPANQARPLYGAIREILIGWGDETLTLPTAFTGSEFAWDADWGPNGENPWSGYCQWYWAGPLEEWNTSVPNRGVGYGGLSLSPRLFIVPGEPEFGMATMYEVAA